MTAARWSLSQDEARRDNEPILRNATRLVVHRQIEPWAAPSFNRPLNRRVLRRLAAIRRASNSSAGMWIVLVAD